MPTPSSSVAAAQIGEASHPLFDRVPSQADADAATNLHPVGSDPNAIAASTARAFLRQLATLREQVKTAHGDDGLQVRYVDVVRGAFENVNDVGRAWIAEQVKPVEETTCEKFVKALRTAFFKMKASGGKTPNFSETTSAPGVSDAVRNRIHTFKDEVLQRDGPYCAVTRARDADFAFRYQELNNTPNLPPPLVNGLFQTLNFCHLLPHALGKDGGELTIAFFSRLTGLDLEQYCGVRIDSPENGIILSGSIHTLQGRFLIGFKPTSFTSTTHQYQVELERKFLQLPDYTPLAGQLINFPASHPDVPPPSPQIMKALYTIYKISHANAAAEALLLPIWRFDAEEMLQGRTLATEEEEEGMVMDYLDARLAVH